MKIKAPRTAAGKWLLWTTAVAAAALIAWQCWGPGVPSWRGKTHGIMSVTFSANVSNALVAVLIAYVALLPVLLSIYFRRLRKERGQPIGNAATMINVAVVILCEIGVAFLSLLAVFLTFQDCRVVTVEGTKYYECNTGFLDPLYTYHEYKGPFLMGRAGIEAGEQRWTDDSENSDPWLLQSMMGGLLWILPQEPEQVPSIDVVPPEASTGTSDPLPSYPAPELDELVIDSEEVGGFTFGIAQVDTAMAGNGAFVAVASSDQGNTWEERGAIADSVSFYSYSAVDADIHVVGFGSSSSDTPPPAMITTDGGWTWSELVLPFHEGTDATAQFVESARLVDGGLVVTANYPSWLAGRGNGRSFISYDDGVTWKAFAEQR